MSVLNILHQSDDGYAKVCGISIVSLLENNKHIDEVNIYYLAYKVSKSNIHKLELLVSKYSNAKIYVIDAQQYHDELVRLNVTSWRGLYVTWLKLLAVSDLKLKGDRILYVNAHTIVNSPLDELLELDFEDYTHSMRSNNCILNDHKQAIGLNPKDGYYNCGVMLINYKKWLDENIVDEVKQSLEQKSNYTIVDQDFCNVVFKGRIKLLSPTYNYSSAYYAYNLKNLIKVNNLKDSYFYSYEELMENYYDPKITHSLFGLLGKPWEQDTQHPQKYLWQKYLSLTPWSIDDMPVAKQTASSRLYKMLPSAVFMQIYKAAVKSKYGVANRNGLLVKVLNAFAPQKGT